MKSLILSIICCVILLAASSKAIRLRGESYPDLKSINAKSLNDKLLRKPESRIIGGEIAPEAYSPWHVSLQNQHGNHFCSGAIIHEQHIVTAASCVAGLDKRNIRVVTGTNDWMDLAGQYYVENIATHCMFDKPMYHNDIALIKLTTKIAYDKKTQNISLAELDELKEGETLTWTGWGSWQLGQHYPNELKKLNGTVVSNEKCKQIYGPNADNIDQGHLCVQPERGSGACHGDTGAPLVDSKGQLVGIGNFGIPCAHGFPDVFAKLSFYNDWLRTSIKGCMLPP